MKQKAILIGIMIVLVVIFSNCTQKSDSSNFKSLYLGQTPPGMNLEIFAQGIVTTDKYESAITVSPDLSEVFFLRKSLNVADNRICYSRIEEGKLTIPEMAPFTYDCIEGYPCFTPDGKRLYYISRRPVAGQDTTSVWGNIWFIDKTKDGWSEPEYLDSPVNDLGPHYLSIDNKGILYFGSGLKCVYYAEWSDGDYPEAVKLPDEINCFESVSHPAIAPDGSYLMVDVYWKENDRIEGSLFISFKRPDGSWTKVVDMKEVLNITDSYIWCTAKVTPDGKYIFVERYIQETHKADLFWISAEIIEELKPDELK